MSLTPGQKLGPYQIVEPIGRGGMGEVYRATDTRLGRVVAIKVSSRQFNDRFQREARAISSLNHPNICTLHDIGSTPEIPGFLVMEYVEGETLGELLRRGLLSLEKSLTYAGQIADALAAAHSKGIVHRDLKPDNIIITPNGVKVLDFGLAKLTQLDSADNEVTRASVTGSGVIIGTPQYMSPEQVEGKASDERSDIFAFGAVSYEMLTGHRAFDGDSSAAVMASIIKDQPPSVRQLRPEVPRSLDRLVRRCLEKSPNDRWHTARDLRAAMEMVDLDADPSPVLPKSGPERRDFLARRAFIAGTVGASCSGILVGVAGAWFWLRPEPASSAPPGRFLLPLADVAIIGHPVPSPDGRWLALRGTGPDGVVRFYLHELNSTDLRPLTGTESEHLIPPTPFWSADSRFIAFSSTPGAFVSGMLKTIDINGGRVQPVCEVSGAVNGSWSRDNVIVFSTQIGDGLFQVPSGGGEPVRITKVDTSRGETRHGHVRFLPDGRRFLYFAASTNPFTQGIYMGSLDRVPEEETREPILLTDRNVDFVPSASGGPGWLLFLKNTILFAQRFDPDRRQLSGKPIPLADQIGSFAAANAGFFGASAHVLAYTQGSISQGLYWLDQRGEVVETVIPESTFSSPALSPDGKSVAYSLLDSQSGDSSIWVLDLENGNRKPITFNRGISDSPVWSPDSKQIVYASNQSGWFDLYLKNSDGNGEETPVLKSESDKQPTSWSTNGYLFFAVGQPGMLSETSLSDASAVNSDLWILPMPQGEARPYLKTPASEHQAQFSPDGEWFAYYSTESGEPKVYVRRFSEDLDPGAAQNEKWQISDATGVAPRWNKDGTELYYIDQEFRVLKVGIRLGNSVENDAPQPMFRLSAFQFNWSISQDGQRFLLPRSRTEGAGPQVVVATDWRKELEE